LICLYYLLKKLRVNRTACQLTAYMAVNCCKMLDFIARDVVSYLLKKCKI